MQNMSSDIPPAKILYALDLALEPQTGDKALAQKTYPGSNSPGNRYQLMPLDTPPPGTYLNVFA